MADTPERQDDVAGTTAPLRTRPPSQSLLPALAARLRRAAPQPLLGIVLGTLGALGLALAWAAPQALPVALTLNNVGLAVVLAGGAVLAQLYPIHVARGFKVSTLTLALYLMAALTTPATAASAAAISVFLGELLQRHVKGQYPSDIASTVGRSVVIVVMGSLLAHLPPPLLPDPALPCLGVIPLAAPLARLPLVLAASALWLGDTLTVSLEISAITGERPFRVAHMVLREGGVAEGAQYLIGFLGALAAERDAWAVVVLVLPAVLLRGLLRRGMEMQGQTRTLLENMADAVDLRDPYTGGHSRRVTAYTAAILRALDVSGPEAALIEAAARVHDIGKIAIPDAILNKPDRLTDEERAVMESHPQRGADFLARYADFRRGIGIVLHHHERIDGQGYPAGLRGNDIPFGARVIAVADSFDAMTSDRPYRSGMPVQKAAAILVGGRGTQWDAAAVDAFVSQVLPSLDLEKEQAPLELEKEQAPADAA